MMFAAGKSIKLRPQVARLPLPASRVTPSRCGAHALKLRSSLDLDNASVLVAGGGGCALEVTRRLKDTGSWVWQLQRTEVRRSQIESMMAILVKGDACQPDDVERAFQSIDGVDVVVSTIGGTTADPSADSQGNINLIDAAVRHGVKKFVLVTSIGAGDSKDAPPAHVYEALKPVLLEKEKAENHLKAMTGKMDYVIIRPGGLSSNAATGKAVLTDDTRICGSITRADVADLVVKVLRSDDANGKVLSAVDRDSVVSPTLNIFHC